MLSNHEWELLDKLIILLMSFEKEMCKFSGRIYVTLSRMILTIKELIFNLTGDFLLDNMTDFLYEDNEIIDTLTIESNDKEVISNFTNKKISIKELLNTLKVLNKVKDNIYNALIFYQNISNKLSLMAAFLDFHYKNLNFV